MSQRGMKAVPIREDGGQTFRSRSILILAFCLCNVFLAALGQPLDVATRLTPWPPEGWPEGAQGEVRLSARGDDGESLETGIVFPIDEAGEVTYRIPESLPRRANSLFGPVELEEFSLCPEVSPTLSPPDAEMVFLGFEIYADGELWGVVDMSAQREETSGYSGESLVALIYARAPLRIGGGGVCPPTDTASGFTEITYDLTLQEGPNVAVIAFEAEPPDTARMTLTTRESLELSGTPVRYSQ